MIVARLISLVIGYVCGLFQTAYIYGKTQGVDIRKEGSGNAGTTNSLRVLGLKAGAITFFGDLLKAIVAVVVVQLIFSQVYPEYTKLLGLYAGFGVVLGHNYPFYMNFKGGKGIASTSGVILAINPWAALVCIVTFIAILLISKYVSLGSIVIVCEFLVLTIIFNQMGLIGVSQELVLEFDILTACFTILAVARHRANIVRLMNGTENKFSIKKK